MTAKLTVLYHHPSNPDLFESHYSQTHMPLARKIPNMDRIEVGKVVSTPDGGAPPYYRFAELTFADTATLQASMGSEQGQAAAGDIGNFATGGVTMFVSETE
jgi:uncharacterized protein (TIGR02118 family)